MSFRATVFFITLMVFAASADARNAAARTAAGGTLKPVITWLSLDWQPAWIFDGPFRGQGYAQQSEHLIRTNLRGYKHQHQRVNNSRIYSTIRRKDACFAASSYKGVDLDEERKKNIIWSAPIFLFFYHGVIVRKPDQAKITKYVNNGFVDFSLLLEDQNLLGAFEPGRAYSRWIDSLLKDGSQSQQLFRWGTNEHLTQRMFNMLDAKRFDYFVDYHLVLRFHELSRGSKSQYSYLPLLEHRGKFGLGAIACNNSPKGRKLIADINTILKDLRLRPAFQDASSRWLMPEAQKDQYRDLWQSELLSKLE